jgi:membrane-bound ClpP family serine protease
MNQPSDLQVKYKKIFPILILVCSIFILCVSLLTGFTPNTITGLILLLLGLLMLTRTVAVITPNEIQMMNLLGMTVKVYSYTPDQIVVTNNSIYVNDKKVISGWWTDINIQEVKAFFLQIQEEK